ncbi:MAG: hypothetical protein J5649_09965 [Lachnospiraceae bacterium]|nr:hypothetical protein [Lachnospiraceae bacterium]
MKKHCVIFVLLVLALIYFCSCSAKTTKPEVSINSAVTDYLLLRNVNDSRIITVDMQWFENYKFSENGVSYWNICGRVDEALRLFYTYSSDTDNIILEGDVVRAEVELCTETAVDTSKHECIIVIGAGMFNIAAERALCGKKSGDVIQVQLSDDGIVNYLQIKDVKTSIKVLSSGSCYAEEDVIKALEADGFSSFEEFYCYLFDVKRNEELFSCRELNKATFFEEAFRICTFDLSEEDIKDYALQIAGEYERTAANLNIELEEFYSGVLNLDEDSFFLQCIQSAEYEIKKALIVGLIAEQYGISVTEDDFVEFCSGKGIDAKDSASRASVRYECLEEKVLVKFGVIFR